MDRETIQRLREPPDPQVSDRPSAPKTWWGEYVDALTTGDLSETAIRVLDLDSGYIVDKGIFGAGAPAETNSEWPATRLRRGLVMGSVQSGKTASLLAVTAKALDRGVDIVVILAGTRIALWRQTYERVSFQLDRWSVAVDSERRTRRAFIPPPTVVSGTSGALELDGLYVETPNLVRRQLLSGKPLVAVVMKNTDHLMQFHKYLHELLKITLPRSRRPLHLLVIDDEADDGSILDKDVEGGLAPDSEGLKQIPRHIARLWSGHGAAHATQHDALFATYLAYTATPQSNFLQSDHNPLSPSDFIAALRTPFEEGSVEPPRSATYAEPAGVAAYYTGGELFYRRLASDHGALCESRAFPQQADFADDDEFAEAVARAREELLSDSLRAFFVSGAIRLYLAGKSLAAARSAAPGPKADIMRVTPKPHSMLYHPSARVDVHFHAAEEIAAWSRVHAPDCVASLSGPTDARGTPELSAAGLTARLAAEEGLWKNWLSSFERTRQRLSFMPSGEKYPVIDEATWPEIRRILVEEVFRFARIAVINSDPRADDRPQFQPEPVGRDRYRAPRDIFTIFVSGNVMARGITLEGLATTLFLRSANDPLADTQMQMQRWFGYRGTILCWCRLFMFADQLALFRAYHEGDEALRRELIEEMNKRSAGAPSPLVLQGADFRATGKIANLRALPLCPGADPFVRVVEFGSLASHNAEILVRLLENDRWQGVAIGGIMRGAAMERQLDLVEVAEILESFRYSDHDPSPSSPNSDRWRALASEIGLEAPEAPLFRPPGRRPTFREAVAPLHCPYSIAAYLRLWSAVLSRRARGLYPTDNRQTPWSMIDLGHYQKSAPKFYVGVRYGSAGPSADSRLAALGVLSMERGSDHGVLRSTWGSRNPGEGDDAYLGDQLFDYHISGRPPPRPLAGEPLWRPRGSPGLVLFHVIQDAAGGADAVTVGLAIPAGGPDHIAALRSGQRGWGP